MNLIVKGKIIKVKETFAALINIFHKYYIQPVKYYCKNHFSFQTRTESELNRLKISKSPHVMAITTNILKENIDLFLIDLHEHVNKFIDFSFSSKISRCRLSTWKRFTLPKNQILACQCPTQYIENLSFF